MKFYRKVYNIVMHISISSKYHEMFATFFYIHDQNIHRYLLPIYHIMVYVPNMYKERAYIHSIYFFSRDGDIHDLSLCSQDKKGFFSLRFSEAVV